MAQERTPGYDASLREAQWPADNRADTEASFPELQEVLFGEYLDHLQNHQRRLDELEASELPRSLPVARALALESKEDPKIRKALHPVIEDALRISVDENPSVMAGILFPMIGEAVRKAVAAATQEMMDSTNAILAQSFSAESVGWRIEAWKSGKSFAEVALTHTIHYRVEHVYAIHRTTGLLLGQATNQANLLQDSDMVVGMLTAIQDFVRDSFTANQQADLDVIQVGEYKIWLQHGPIALVAAVIRGQPKAGLRNVLVQQVEDIHRNFQGGMQRFEASGQTIPGLAEELDACLVEEVQEGAKKKQSYTKFKVAGWILLALVCIVGFYFGRRALNWSDYIDRLRHQPGLIVIDESLGWMTSTVHGLRDPMAVDPEAILEKYDIAPDKVSEHWEPYYSLDARFAGARKLGDEADALRREAVRFQMDSTTLPTDQFALLDTIGDQVQALAADAGQQRRSLHIQIFGHTDTSGSSEHNDMLSQYRAEAVMRFLVARGVNPNLLSAAGLRDTQLQYNSEFPEGQDLDRRVTFAVDLR